MMLGGEKEQQARTCFLLIQALIELGLQPDLAVGQAQSKIFVLGHQYLIPIELPVRGCKGPQFEKQTRSAIMRTCGKRPM